MMGEVCIAYAYGIPHVFPSPDAFGQNALRCTHEPTSPLQWKHWTTNLVDHPTTEFYSNSTPKQGPAWLQHAITASFDMPRFLTGVSQISPVEMRQRCRVASPRIYDLNSN
jgi:hypothetical protein